MNMISTGAFLNEMDASNKQPTVAEKFAAVWEKKNAKAARAGGVSLMALSLAACGSSSTTTTTSTDTSTDTTTTTTPTAQSVVFTKDIDILNGGAGDDTFIGDSATVSAADQVTGGAGTDTVKVYGGTTLPTMSGVEAVEIHHTAMADMNVATGALAGISSVLINGAEASDKTITIGSGDTITLQAMGANTSNDQVSIAAAATVTSATVNVIDMSDTTGVIIDPLGTGITSMTINETGSLSKSYVDFLADTASVTVSTLTINATGKGIDILDVDDATTIDASGSTAAVNLDTAINKVTITGGSGNDDFSLDHANSVAFEGSVSGGAGNDKITITSLNGAVDLVDNKVTLDGGDGDDTLTMINALADELTDLSAANYAKKGIANFEKLVISDVTTNDALDFVTPATGFKDITLAGGQGADNTFTVYDGTTLTLGESGSATNDTATVTVSGAAGAGRNSDTFTLKLAADASGGSIEFGEMNVANVETINIESTIKASTTNASSNDNDVDLVIANAKTVTVTGDTGLLLSGDAFDGVIETFDASGLTGNINVSFAGGAGVTYTASNGVNVMVGSSNADLINGSASGDTITGGDGIDVITLGAAGKVDTVKMGGIIATANRDTIKGFDATGTNKDVIQVTATDTAVATNATDAPVQQTVSALAASTTAADVDFVEFAFEAAVDLTSSSTGTTFLKAISNTSSAASLTVDAEGDELYAIAYQGGDAFLFYIQDATASDSDTGAVQNDEIFLVATIEGVAVGALTMANFDLA